MFVGCSEISISVIVKHVQHIGIIRAFCLPGETCQVFQCPGRQKNLLDCGLLVGDQYPDYALQNNLIILLNEWHEKSGCSKRNENTIPLVGDPSLDPSNAITVNIDPRSILLTQCCIQMYFGTVWMVWALRKYAQKNSCNTFSIYIFHVKTKWNIIYEYLKTKIFSRDTTILPQIHWK